MPSTSSQLPSPSWEKMFEDLLPSEQKRENLRSRLLERAEAESLLDATYSYADSPLGSLLLVQADRGVLRIGFEAEGHRKVLSEVEDRLGQKIMRSSQALDPVVRELDEYFQGRRREFSVLLDPRFSTGFRREVIESLRTVAYGSTSSYADIAKALDRPKAVRAVGTACATNPLPILLPCHRVVRSDGSTGNYLAGAMAKTQLLAFEQAVFRGEDLGQDVLLQGFGG